MKISAFIFEDFIFALNGLKTGEGETKKVFDLIEENELKFKENMDNDLNISGAIGVFFEFIHKVNLIMDNLKKTDIEAILAYVNRINSVIGVIKTVETETLDDQILKKVQLREKARKEKNFILADSLRDELKAMGVILIDTPDGVRWKQDKL